MTVSNRRLLVFLAAGLLVMLAAAGCTLTGANPAPLTPMGPGGEGLPPASGITPTPMIGEGEPDVIDVTPLGGEEEPPAEDTPSEGTEEATPEEGGEATEETPTDEAPAEETAEPTPEETAVPPAEGSADCPASVTIDSGDTLFSLALRYGVTVEDLAAANGLEDIDQLSVGQVINIPGCAGTADGTASTGSGSVHVVQAGENLYRIALSYGLTAEALAAHNGISVDSLLSIGQELRIP